MEALLVMVLPLAARMPVGCCKDASGAIATALLMMVLFTPLLSKKLKISMDGIGLVENADRHFSPVDGCNGIVVSQRKDIARIDWTQVVAGLTLFTPYRGATGPGQHLIGAVV